MRVDATELIDRLEVFRLEKKISQEDLAKKLDVAFSTVNRWFNRRSQPKHIQRYHIRKMMGEDTPHNRNVYFFWGVRRLGE